MKSDKVIAVVLAAGLSSRMGNNKLLMPLGGKPVIEHVVSELLKSTIDSVAVVGGKDYQAIQTILESYPLIWVYNKNYREGQAESIKEAVKILMEDTRLKGILFVMGDQPLLAHDKINEMLDIFKQYEERILVPVDPDGRRGAPVIFHRKFFEDLLTLQGDQGGKRVIAGYPGSVIEYQVPEEHFFWDVDTIESFEKVKEWWKINEKKED